MTTRQIHAELPPRHPIQKKPIIYPVHDPVFAPSRHLQSSPQYGLEEHPAWFDDLFSDPIPDSIYQGKCLLRSASDPVTLLDSLVDSLPILTFPFGAENSADKAVSSLESACIYGPNSPRQLQRGSSSFSDSAIVSELSECVSEEPLHHVDGDLPTSGIRHSEARTDICGAVKRHAGQRSRIRKLQYIAELEKTVNVLQALVSELAVKVASLLQQRLALSTENSKLKQQMVRLQQKKLIVDGEYQFLKKEVQRLKTNLMSSRSGNVWTNLGSNITSKAGRLEATKMTLNMEKLYLN